jgi:CelD/BcsL family acetyltransferase involved in cellulose biosynthesis
MGTLLLPRAEAEVADLALARATTADDVLALRPAWECFSWRSIDAQLDWFLAAAAARRNLVLPLVVVAGRDGVPEGMVMAHVERRRPVPFHRAPRVRVAVVAENGLVGSQEARVALLRHLFATTGAVCLRAVAPGGSDHQALQAAVPAPSRPPVRRATPRWRIDLPDDYDLYVAGLPANLRRARRKEARALEARHGERLELVRHSGPDTAAELLADVESVAARSYQRDLGVGFERERHGMLVHTALRLGLCRAWVLRIAGRPVAFELGWTYRHTYRGEYIGHDPAFRREAVGGYVEQQVIRDLCADPAITVYDQGEEDYDYKRRLSNRSVPETDVWAFGPRPGALAGLALRSGYELARQLRRG